MRTVGIIGAGGMGKTHARHYNNIGGLRLLAYDVDAERLQTFCDEAKAETAAGADDLMEKSDIVDICLPTHLHADLAVQSLGMGKATLCEKPMARTVADCARIAEAAAKSSAPFMPAQVVRWFPEFRKAHDMVQSGAVGNASAIRTRRCGRHPQGAGGWFTNYELSGGVLMDLAVHDFDWIRWTFGEAERAYANGIDNQWPAGLDYALVTLTLQSGAIAHTEASWADPGGFRAAFEVAGSEGFFEYDNRWTPPLRTVNDKGTFNESPMAPADDPYLRQLSAFIEAVENNTEPPVTAVDGLRAVAIAEAAIESAKTGKAIKPALG
jgi:predicted dehydrogenase